MSSTIYKEAGPDKYEVIIKGYNNDRPIGYVYRDVKNCNKECAWEIYCYYTPSHRQYQKQNKSYCSFAKAGRILVECWWKVGSEYFIEDEEDEANISDFFKNFIP